MKINQLISLLFFGIFFLFHNMMGNLKMTADYVANKEKHIFFDVGHVLVKPSLVYAFWQVGPRKIANFIWKHKKLVSREFLQKRLFEYINHCSGQPTHASIISCNQPIPQIVYDWVIGKIDSESLLNYIHQNRPAKKTFFDSDEERELVLATANLFKSNVHVTIQRKIQSMVCFFQECAKAYPGKVYILSNWDKSCALLKTEFPDIFNAIADDHIIFSANVGCAKPDRAIFDCISTRFNLQPSQCILIDDLPENIAGITKWGGHGILYVDNYKTHRELEKLLVYNE